MNHDIEYLLSLLTAKERQVLIWRYGLDGSKPFTLEQIGNRFNIGKERIRQVEARAFYKLRRNRTLKNEHFFL